MKLFFVFFNLLLASDMDIEKAYSVLSLDVKQGKASTNEIKRSLSKIVIFNVSLSIFLIIQFCSIRDISDIIIK